MSGVRIFATACNGLFNPRRVGNRGRQKERMRKKGFLNKIILICQKKQAKNPKINSFWGGGDYYAVLPHKIGFLYPAAGSKSAAGPMTGLDILDSL